jgi:hypothetical protein
MRWSCVVRWFYRLMAWLQRSHFPPIEIGVYSIQTRLSGFPVV